MIQINTQNNTLITGSGEPLNLTKESRDKVLEAVAQIRGMLENKGENN